MWFCVSGKTPWKVNLNGILNDWNQISGKLQNFDLKIKIYLSFSTTFRVKYFEINNIIWDWEMIWSQLINI